MKAAAIVLACVALLALGPLGAFLAALLVRWAMRDRGRQERPG